MKKFSRIIAAVPWLIGSIAACIVPSAANAFTYELVIEKSVLLKYGRDSLYKGNLARAEDYYQRALESNLSTNDKRRAHNDLCVVYFFKREFDRAMGHCDSAVKLAPNQWRPYNNRANIHLERGDFDLALKDYEKGLKLYPSSDVMAGNRDLAVARAKEQELAAVPVEAGEDWLSDPVSDRRREFLALAED